jgi:hypothetical protein
LQLLAAAAAVSKVDSAVCTDDGADAGTHGAMDCQMLDRVRLAKRSGAVDFVVDVGVAG